MTVREAGGCNLCNPSLRAAVAAGERAVFDLADKHCKSCKSPIRHMALAHMLESRGVALLNELGLAGRTRALLAAPGPREWVLLKPLAASTVSFSLFGQYGPGHVSCDIRDLSQFESASFDLFEASCVFDYVPELVVAVENVARVLARPAVFFIHIHDARLVGGSKAPRVTRTRDRSGGLPDYYPEGYVRQHITVGRLWFDAAWRRHGFAVEQFVWGDAILGQPITWWIGWRK